MSPMSPSPIAHDFDVLPVGGKSSLASKVGTLGPAGQCGGPQLPLQTRAPMRKDIRHLNSRCGVAANFSSSEALAARPPPQVAGKITGFEPPVSSRSASTCGTNRAAQLNDASHANGMSRRSLLSSSDSAKTLVRTRSLSKLREWSDDDYKPRMALRAEFNADEFRPRTAREARTLVPAGRPSIGKSSRTPRQGQVPNSARAISEDTRATPRRSGSTGSLLSPSPNYTSWAQLVAEAEEVGAALQSSWTRRRGEQGLLQATLTDARRKVEKKPAGTASSPSRKEAAVLLRGDPSLSITPRSASKTQAIPGKSISEVLLSIPRGSSPRRYR